MNSENLKKAVQLRHELHMHPELSNQESWTKQHLIAFLREHAQELEIHDMGRWFYAAYRSGGNQPGIALRADFDAVPVADCCDVPWKSAFEGIGHKCGHDGHSACLAATALEVCCVKPKKDVFFLFQHAEETGDGARECTALFDRESVGEIFGLHNRPGVPIGSVQIMDGTFYCASMGLMIHYTGKPSHASMPELGINPAFAIAEIISSLSTFTVPEEHEGLVLATIIQVSVGERAFGIQASTGDLLLTIRAQYDHELELLRSGLERMAMEKAAEHGLHCEVSYADVFPETAGTPEEVEKVRRVCAKLGIPCRELDEPFRSSEDFGWYTKAIPGAFFELGSGDTGNLHTETMDFPDAAIPTAVAVYLALITE